MVPKGKVRAATCGAVVSKVSVIAKATGPGPSVDGVEEVALGPSCEGGPSLFLFVFVFWESLSQPGRPADCRGVGYRLSPIHGGSDDWSGAIDGDTRSHTQNTLSRTCSQRNAAGQSAAMTLALIVGACRECARDANKG